MIGNESDGDDVGGGGCGDGVADEREPQTVWRRSSPQTVATLRPRLSRHCSSHTTILDGTRPARGADIAKPV